MNKDIPVNVVVPERTAGLIQKFPVVYLLHGYGGSYSDWARNTELTLFANRYQVIIVCPDGSNNSWYLDSPIDSTSQYETFMVHELIDWIDDHYPTIANKNGRAITGLSMGGHGSLYLAIRHPERYIAAGSMSGGVDLTFSTDSWEIANKLGTYKDFPERWYENSVINMVRCLKNRDIKLLIDCGVADIFIDINRKLHQTLLDLEIPHDYYERPGGHSWEFWVRVLEYHLMFFQEAFNEKKY